MDLPKNGGTQVRSITPIKMTACFIAEEVQKHNKSSDCWIIYKEKVYDVTPFLEDVKIIKL